MEIMDIFNYKDYKVFLKDIIKQQSMMTRGTQRRLSEAMGCQSAYLSQVLNKQAHLNFEQAYLAADFFNLTDMQLEYFLILVHIERAGNYKLKSYYENKRKNIYQKQLNLKNRLNANETFSKEEQLIYYSSWHYLAVHALLSLSIFDYAEISLRLNIPIKKVQAVIEFLHSSGFILKDDDGFKLTSKQFHLGSDSPMINKHHTNWKMRAIESLDRVDPHDLHYSSVITISKENIPKFRSIMVEVIEKLRKVTKDSTDEENVYCYCLDFFEIG